MAIGALVGAIAGLILSKIPGPFEVESRAARRLHDRAGHRGRGHRGLVSTLLMLEREDGRMEHRMEVHTGRKATPYGDHRHHRQPPDAAATPRRQAGGGKPIITATATISARAVITSRRTPAASAPRPPVIRVEAQRGALEARVVHETVEAAHHEQTTNRPSFTSRAMP